MNCPFCRLVMLDDGGEPTCLATICRADDPLDEREVLAHEKCAEQALGKIVLVPA